MNYQWSLELTISLHTFIFNFSAWYNTVGICSIVFFFLILSLFKFLVRFLLQK